MALNFSNIVKKDPLIGASRDIASPFSVTSKKKSPTPALQSKLTDPSPFSTPGLVTAPKNTAPSPVVSTPVQSSSQTPQGSSAPIKGLLSPDYSSLSAGLKGLQAGLVDLQKQNEAKSFPNIVGGLVETSHPSTAQKSLVDQVVRAGEGNVAIGQEAARLSKMYGDEIARIGNLGAGAVAGNLSTGTDVVGSGNAAIASQSASSRMNALAAAQEAALKGTGQQLTAQEQMTGAFNQALGGTNTQQAQSLSGLNMAGSLASPQLTSPGQAAFNPITGEFSGGITPEIMQQYAQLAVSGQYSAIPSTITSNPVLNAQLNQAAQRLNPGFNPVTAQGASGVIQQLPALQSAETAAEGIKNTIVSFLSSNPQLNASDASLLNAAQQWVEGKQLTDPKYQTLFNYLNEYTNTLAPILGVGGNPTNLKTEIAASFVNARASGQSISQVLESISMLAKNKLADMQSGALGGGTNVPTPVGGGYGGGNDQGWGWNP